MTVSNISFVFILYELTEFATDKSAIQSASSTLIYNLYEVNYDLQQKQSRYIFTYQLLTNLFVILFCKRQKSDAVPTVHPVPAKSKV